MNKKDKRKFTAAFKVKVAMAAVKGRFTPERKEVLALIRQELYN